MAKKEKSGPVAKAKSKTKSRDVDTNPARATSKAMKSESKSKAVAKPPKTSLSTPVVEAPLEPLMSSSKRPRTRVSIPPPEERISAEAAQMPPGGQLIYFFSPSETEGDPSMKDILGGKGSGLAGMAKAGLPVPPGFTIPTYMCN